MPAEFLDRHVGLEHQCKLDSDHVIVNRGDWLVATGEPARIDLLKRECEQAEEAYSQVAVRLDAMTDLLPACKAALELPRICEEIGYAGEHDCVRDGHAMVKTADGEYVTMHTQGGYPARERILVMLRAAIAKGEKV